MTTKLAVFFILAFIGIFLLMHAVGALVFTAIESESTRNFDFADAFLDPLCALIDLAIVGAFVILGAVWKTRELRSLGVEGVAKSLGATPVRRGSPFVWERRLYNVVEEIAIAAGVPVPATYIMNDEPAVNACAFGTGPENAGVCVTRGALDLLSRDELQGVIGHEFSHIVNRDVNLNMRLVGAIFGIEIIATIALFVIRSLSGVRVSSSSNKKGGAGAVIVAIFLVALALFLIGSVGIFFGNLIRAAISRQREYLADASSVQFTRNPQGLAGALKKIGSSAVGSAIVAPHANQMSHLFFCNVFSKSFIRNLFQTHPDLVSRIKAIDPDFNGVFPKTVVANAWNTIFEEGDFAPDSLQKKKTRAQKNLSGALRANSAVSNATTANFAVDPRVVYGDALDAVVPARESANDSKIAADPTPAALSPDGKALVSKRLLEPIPPQVSQMINLPDKARALFCALMTSDDPDARKEQRKILLEEERELLGGFDPEESRSDYDFALSIVEPLSLANKLIVARMIVPTFKATTRSEYEYFRNLTMRFCGADKKLDLFEYAALAAVVRELDVYFRLVEPPRIKYSKLEDVAPFVVSIVGFLARYGEQKPGDAPLAYRHAVDFLGISNPFPAEEKCGLIPFMTALNECAQTVPMLKQKILQATWRCIVYDGVVTEKEAAAVCAATAAFGAPAPVWREWAQ